MMALTVRQPWASLIVHGPKHIETRSKPTKIRGRIGIIAGKWSPPALDRDTSDDLNWLWNHAFHRYDLEGNSTWTGPDDMPLGALIGTVELYDCVPISWPGRDLIGTGPAVITHYVNSEELHLWAEGAERYSWGSDGHDITDQLPYGDFTPGRFAWLLRNPEPLERPVPTKGTLGWKQVEL